MLPLPPFTLHRPTTLAEALSTLRSLGDEARVIAGGTDLLPNMKLGLDAPSHLVSLTGVPGLSGVRVGASSLSLGAMTTLDAIARDGDVRAHAAALAEAAASVGGPHHRRMGTLGGNLCLDTRCRYYNQSEFWRAALGFCLKRDGDTCHVVAGGRRCVAAASNDTAAALIALDAFVTLASPEGERVVAARDFYTADGARNNVRGAHELVVSVAVPRRDGRRSAYEKLRRRGAIDFPMLSVGARVDVREGRVEAIEVAVSALAARPRSVSRAEDLAVGLACGEVPVEAIAEAARRACNPLPNIEGEVLWRREMVAVLVRRALVRCLA